MLFVSFLYVKYVPLRIDLWFVYRLHAAILDRPPSSAATMEVQGPDTQ